MNLDFLDFKIDFANADTIKAYDEVPLWSAMFGLLMLEYVPLEGITSALDVGCGTGFPLIELAERLAPGSHVHGIDPWGGALERAAEKIAIRRTQNVTLHEGSAAKMPFSDGSFDLIVSNLGINNFDDREAVIRECYRVARRGATVALTTNLQGHMKEFYAAFADALTDADSRARLKAHIEHRATLDGVRQLLGRGGFKVRSVEEKTEVMRFASGEAMLNHYFIKLGFLDAWKEVVTGNERQVFSRLIEKLRGEVRLTIPMAYVEAVRG